MKPIGPLRERIRYRKSPTTTGGKPIKVFRMLTTRLFPKNRLSPMTAPRGMPETAAMQSARPETLIDRQIIPKSSGSR